MLTGERVYDAILHKQGELAVMLLCEDYTVEEGFVLVLAQSSHVEKPVYFLNLGHCHDIYVR